MVGKFYGFWNEVPRDLVAGCCLLATLASGPACTKVGYSEPHVVSTTPIREDVKILSRRSEIGAQVRSMDGKVVLSVFRRCLQEQREEVVARRVTVKDRYNASPATDNVLAVLGGLTAVGGVYFIADAKRVAAGSSKAAGESSGTANGTGSTSEAEVRGLGVAVLAIGAACLTTVLVDVVRTTRSEEIVEDVTLDPTTNENASCGIRPYPGVAVEGRLGERRFPIGTTGSQGTLVVDLGSAIPDGMVDDLNTAQEMAFIIDGKPVASIQLKALLGAIADGVWARLSPSECDQGDPNACEALESYVSHFPSSRHVESARRHLARGQGPLQRRQLELQQEREHLEAEQHKQLEEKERQDAEQRRQRQEQEAQERKEKAQKAARTQCVAICRNMCGGAGSCVSACIAGKCR